MGAVETLDMAERIAAVLTGDAVLADLLEAAGAPRDNIWRIPAPPDVSFPVVLYGLQPDSATDTAKAVGLGRLLVVGRWQVKVVHRNSDLLALRDIAVRLDTLMAQASGPAPGGTVLDVDRNGPLDYPETIEGVQYQHLGGLWSVQAHATT